MKALLLTLMFFPKLATATPATVYWTPVENTVVCRVYKKNPVTLVASTTTSEAEVPELDASTQYGVKCELKDGSFVLAKDVGVFRQLSERDYWRDDYALRAQVQRMATGVK